MSENKLNCIRFESIVGKFGVYFHDRKTYKDMTILEIKEKLNEISELEKQNEELIKNTLILLDCLCSPDGCQDFKYCGRLKESKCSEILNSEKLICEIKQKPIKDILNEYNE